MFEVTFCDLMFCAQSFCDWLFVMGCFVMVFAVIGCVAMVAMECLLQRFVL